MALSYWEERQIEVYEKSERIANRYFTRLDKAFLDTKKKIQSEINDFYARYAGNNNMTYAEAQKAIDKTALKGLKEFINKVNAHIGEYDDEVERLSIKSRITRLKEVETRIDGYLRELYKIDYEAGGKDALRDVYDESYYRTWYNIDRFKKVHNGFNAVDPRKVDKLIQYPFNGQNFSDRLWKQKEYLQGRLIESLTAAVVQGRNPAELAKDFSKKFATSEANAYRLIHTESSYIIEQANMQAYKEDDVEEYTIIAVLDSKTCAVCGGQDSQHYKLEDETPGINAPPFHPNCRCTTAPYYPDTGIEKRLAIDEKGKTYDVPGDMTYEEWKKKYVDNTRKNVIIRVAKENGIKGIVNMEPKPIDLSDYTFDNKHINAQRGHNISREEAEQFMNDAAVSLTKWDGRFVNYYGKDGAVFIDKKKKKIRTAFGKGEFDVKTSKFIKEIYKDGR